MKTERRHELQTNELADRLTHWIAAAEPYARTILGVLLAIVAIVFAYGLISLRDSERANQGWDKLFAALETQNPQELEKTATDYSTTKVSQWARLASADLVLNGCINKLLTDKTEAQDELRRVAELYHRVLTESEDKSPLIPRAKFGLARTQESQGDLTRARELYNDIVREGGPFAAAAKERAEDLDRAETKEFYAWLASYQPPRPVEKPDKKIDFIKEPLSDGASSLGLQPLISKDSPLMNTGSTPPGAAKPPTGEAASPGGESPAAAPAGEKPAAPDGATPPATDAGPSLNLPAATEPAPAPAAGK
jgi:hypothetical protein